MVLMPDANVDRLMMLMIQMVKFVHQCFSFLTSVTNIIIARFEINGAYCVRKLLYWNILTYSGLSARKSPLKKDSLTVKCPSENPHSKPSFRTLVHNEL